jgi:hypothetical protein
MIIPIHKHDFNQSEFQNGLNFTYCSPITNSQIPFHEDIEILPTPKSYHLIENHFKNMNLSSNLQSLADVMKSIFNYFKNLKLINQLTNPQLKPVNPS